MPRAQTSHHILTPPKGGAKQTAEKCLTAVNRHAPGNHPVRRLMDTPPESVDFYPHLWLDTGVNFGPQPRRGLHSVAVGKCTFFVPAAHGKLPIALPTLKGSNIQPLAGSPVGSNVGAEHSTPPGSRRGRDRQPWVAGTKNVPLPTAIQFSPLQGGWPCATQGFTPSVSSKRCGTRSVQMRKGVRQPTDGVVLNLKWC